MTTFYHAKYTKINLRLTARHTLALLFTSVTHCFRHYAMGALGMLLVNIAVSSPLYAVRVAGGPSNDTDVNGYRYYTIQEHTECVSSPAQPSTCRLYKASFELWRYNITTYVGFKVNQYAYYYTSEEGPSPLSVRLGALGNTLYFTYPVSRDTLVLAKIDNSSTSSTIITSLPALSDAKGYLWGLNGRLYFALDDEASQSPTSMGNELWVSDGTKQGTHLVKDMNPGTGSSNPTDLVSRNGLLYFNAFDGTNTFQWKSDGTEAGTVKVALMTSKVRINCGGDSFRVANGLVYQADVYYNGLTKAAVTSGDIANTINDVLYHTDRVADIDKGSFQYQIPVTNGKYQVNLFFAETYFTLAGKRVMSVSAEGTTILSNYDIFAAQGKRTAKGKSYFVTVSDGNMTLDFSATVNRPKINAIEIIPAPTSATRQEGESELASELVSAAALVAYPNPFTNQATIHFTAPASGKAGIAVYDLNGNLVKVLFDGELEEGVTKELTLQGTWLPSGIYLVKATSSVGVSHLKLVLTK